MLDFAKDGTKFDHVTADRPILQMLKIKGSKLKITESKIKVTE